MVHDLVAGAIGLDLWEDTAVMMVGDDHDDSDGES